MDLELKQLLNQEDYIRTEKLKFLKLDLFFSLSSFFFFLGQTVICFLLNEMYSESIPLLFGILSIFGIINSIFQFFWAWRTRKTLLLSSDKWGENMDSYFTRILFTSSILLFFYQIILLILTFIWKSRGVGLVLTNGTYSLSDYNEEWDLYSLILSILTLFSSLSLIYLIFCLFVFCGSPNTIRGILYFFGIIEIIAGFLTLFNIKIALEFENIESISSFVKPWIFEGLMALIIIQIIIIFISYIINYGRERSGYLMTGTSKIILIALLIGITGLIYRQALNIENSFEKNCKFHLSDISQSDLKNYGCENKYLQLNQNTLSCPENSQVLVWESDSTAKNSIACLNLNCCNVIGDVFEIHLLRLVAVSLWLIVNSFVSIVACFYLTNKYSGERGLKKFIEYIYMTIAILIVIAGIVSIFFYTSSFPETRKIVSPSDTKQFKLSTPQVHYLKSKELMNSQCQNIGTYTPVYKATQPPAYSDPKYGVRTIVLVKNGDIYFDKKFDNSNIFIYDQTIGSSLFNTIILTDYSYLVFQGTFTNVKDFVQSIVKVCPKQGLTPVVKYFNAIVDLNTNKYVAANNIETISRRNINSKEHLASIVSPKTGDFSALQNSLNLLKYGNLELHVFLSDTKEALKEADILIFKNQLECKSNLKDLYNVIRTSKTDSKGRKILYNLEYGTYTVVIKSNNAKTNCKTITINTKETISSIYTVNNLEKDQIAVQLTWNSELNLALFSTFNLENSNCVVGYMNTYCSGTSFSSMSDEKTKVHTIKIKKLGEYNYLFFLRNVISSADAQTNVNFNKDFTNAKFIINVFVNELEVPVDGLTNGPTVADGTYSKDDSISLITYCFEGKNSDVAVLKNNFVKGIAFPVTSSCS